MKKSVATILVSAGIIAVECLAAACGAHAVHAVLHVIFVAYFANKALVR